MNELNLYDLFKQIIEKSKTIKRFVLAPEKGAELNKNNLGEIIQDVLGGLALGVKYPLCIMLPPVEIIDNYERGWSKFKCKMFFLDKEYNNSNGQSATIKSLNLSAHSVKQNWKDMRGCAIDFRRAVQHVTGLQLSAGIRDGQGMDVIDRLSNVANDRLAGVGLSFDMDLHIGCNVDDYDTIDLNNIIINLNDLHLRHEQ